MLNPDSVSDQKVLAIHGLGGHRLVMTPLCHRLKRMGYQVQNWGYRSLWTSISQHADAFRDALQAADEDGQVARFHVVSHSMGSIVLRVALQSYQPRKLHRIVMLCPPNHGSTVAAKFSPVLGWLSKTLTEISDHPESYVNRIDEAVDSRYEIGVIRAETDFVVTPESTQMTVVREYVQLPGMHSSIVARALTADYVHRFLQRGTFHPEPQEG